MAIGISSPARLNGLDNLRFYEACSKSPTTVAPKRGLMWKLLMQIRCYDRFSSLLLPDSGKEAVRSLPMGPQAQPLALLARTE